jgi:acyl phosphate:glycerol-3-phosphate acyltransferase
MAEILTTAGVPLVGYLLGAVPFALLIGGMVGIDLRTEGTGNVGAGNLTKVAGLPYGLAAAILDGLKGLVPVLIARRMGLADGLAAAAGVAAVLGHNWSIYLRSRSGRGLATSVGVMVGLAPSLLVWTGLWSVIGWWIGGGLGGFIGWSLLGPVAVVAGHSRAVMLTAFTLSLIVFLRRAQGQAGDSFEWRDLAAGIVWDTDRRPEAVEDGAAERPVR